EYESELIIRCETINLLTEFVIKTENENKQVLDTLIGTLKDYSPEVRIESIKSFFMLIDMHKSNNMNLDSLLLDIVNDEDIWVKEYLAGALLNNLNISDEIKWKLLINLIIVNKDDEWILNETAMAVGNLVNKVTNEDILIDYLYQLFEIGLESDTIEKIRINISDNKTAKFFELFVNIKEQNLKKLVELFSVYQKEFGLQTDGQSISSFLSKVQICVEMTRQSNIDDIIENKYLSNLSNLISKDFNISRLIKNLNEYSNENYISDKIVFLNYALDSIEELKQYKSKLNNVDCYIVNLSIYKLLIDLINKTSRLLRENIYLDIEIENRDISINENGIGDINFDIINNGYNKIEEIDIAIKPNPQYDIIENAGAAGELVKDQRKKIYCKIKSKVLGVLELVFEISYKKCEIPIILNDKIFIKDNINREWIPIPNPYTVGIPIDNDEIFVGRKSLIEETLIAIRNDAAFVNGHRRMGKTSFVKFIIRNYLNKESYIPVYLSAEILNYGSNIKDFLFSFADPIITELEDIEFLTDEKASFYRDNIRQNGFIDFGIFFKEILRKIKKQNKILVVVIDEYPKIHENVDLGIIDPQFTSYLRGYMQNNSKEFKMIYTGASSLKYFKSQYSSNIMGVGNSVVISFLSEDEVKELIAKPTNNQMQFDDSAFKYLMEMTYGQPYLIQLILYNLVNILNKERKSSIIFKETIEEQIEYYLDQATHLKTDWGSFDTDPENRFVSSNINWNEGEEITAKVYKQLIITAITDNWTKS
ncbi:MAG TPA: AAA-like domain-containing protein, partial [Ignavibacteria bacterium]